MQIRLGRWLLLVMLVAAGVACWAAVVFVKKQPQTLGAEVKPSVFVAVDSPSGELMVARHETTVKQWLACVEAGKCPNIKVDKTNLDHPMTGVNWRDVAAYLAWYRAWFAVPVRLPTRAEWLAFAANQAPQPQVKLFSDPRMAWAADYDLSAVPQTSKTVFAGAFGSNQLGLYDIVGNVWEWTQSCQVELDFMPAEQFGCVNGRYAMGTTNVALEDELRSPGNSGCGGGQPPANVGFRLVYTPDI